ncbi:hypothetical protein, partial [Novosphingobium mangrovi (ex Huang et al. 2023)]
ITPCRSLQCPPTQQPGERSEHGSLLSGNLCLSRVNSQRKSTLRPLVISGWGVMVVILTKETNFPNFRENKCLDKFNSPNFERDFVQLILDFDNEIRNLYGVNAITNELRLVLHVLLNGDLTIKESSIVSNLSNRGFHEMMKRMKERNLISSTENIMDKRSKLVKISTEFSMFLKSYAQGFVGQMVARFRCESSSLRGEGE